VASLYVSRDKPSVVVMGNTMKLYQLGNSTAGRIKRQVALYRGWEPGDWVNARLVSGGPFIKLQIRSVSAGQGVGVIFPAAVLREHGFTRGQVIDVPFTEWETLRKAPKNAAVVSPTPKRRKTATKRTAGGAKARHKTTRTVS
jgi:antitoxin component of MazEF toxin-antitoxin module